MRSREQERELKKKKQKSTLVTDLFFIILTCIASAYFIYSLLQLNNIENLIRYIIIGLVSLLDLIMIINLFRGNRKKIVRKWIKRVFLVILISIYIFIGYNINRTVGIISNMNKNEVTNSTALVTLKSNTVTKVDEINKAKIGIGSESDDTESYVLPMEIVDEYKLKSKNELVTYEDYITEIRDLYNKKVDYIFLPANYVSIYESMDGYEDIGEKTKIIIQKTKDEKKNDEDKLLGSSKDITEPFTVLLMGVDSTANGIKNANSFNGDSIMLITFNPKTLNVTMLSIPRDSYVPISCFSGKPENKITHAASRGTSCVIKTVQDFTGIKIDYYAKINFTGLVDLVNSLGGIDVDVPYAFCEQNSKRKWGKNTIYVKKGKQHLNGEQALALARNRKNNAKKCGSAYAKGTRNDFVRGQNQQLVIKAIINKAKNLDNISKVYKILDAISNNLDTNMKKDTILSFYNVVKDIMTSAKDKDSELVSIQKLYLAGSDQIIYDERSGLELYEYIPNQYSKTAIVNAMKVNLGLKSEEKTKKFSYSIEDEYDEEIIGKKPSGPTELYTLIPDFTTYTRSRAENWASNNGFTITWNEKKVTSGVGIITNQSYHRKKRVDLCSPKNITLTITVAKQQTISKPTTSSTEESTNEEGSGSSNTGENTGSNENGSGNNNNKPSTGETP